MKRVIGEIQRRLMIFGLGNNYVYSTVGLLIGFVSIYRNIVPAGIDGNNNEIEVLIIILSAISIVYKFIIETKELDERNNELIEVGVNTYKRDVREKIVLSSEYTDSGYYIDSFNNEKFVISDKVNDLIYDEKVKLMLQYSGKFVLSNEVKQISAYALNKAFKARNTIYNSKLIRLADEIFLYDNNIRIQRTDYFQGLCTNEMVYSKLKSITQIHDPFIFEGEDLLINSNNKLIHLCESLCSNYLGGSTLAITNDKYIIINSQSNKSAANSGRFAPSGSGSTDYRDFKILKRKYKNKEKHTFQELVKITMERELREECGLVYRRIRMKSKIIGFARLLERGGKPDFFGITYVNASHNEIKKSLKEWLEIGNYKIELIKFEKYSEIPDKLLELITKDNNKISIQIYILYKILKCFYEKEIDLFEEIVDA